MNEKDLRLIPQFRAYERFTFRRGTQSIFKTVIFYLAESRSKDIKISDEHHGYGWFTFRDARALVDYFSTLGISDCYLSPCVKACAGTMHGYDIVDHNTLNPEIGSFFLSLGVQLLQGYGQTEAAPVIEP